MNRLALKTIQLLSLLALAFLANGCGGSSNQSSQDPEVLKQPVGITISPTSATIATSAAQPFKVSVTGTTNTGVTWSVDKTPGGNSTIGTISAAGVYTAPAAAGKHTIAVTSLADPTKSASAAVTVNASAPPPAAAAVLTERFDLRRSGAILTETVLTRANVNVSTFGKISSYPVDGFIYTQPLYLQNLAIPGQGTHNVVFVATENDSVYAFDADAKQSSYLWKTSFINPPAVTTVPQSDVGSTIYPFVGITGTPVIDPSTNTLYVVAFTKESGSYFQRLHALDITTGHEKFGGPVVIQGTVPGTGVGNDGSGNVPFNPMVQLQRPGLLLMNGNVYIAFGSHGDNGAYHGWIFAYSAATLQQVGVLNITPNGQDGAIWQAGAGLSADTFVNIFTVTSNGDFNYPSGPNLGDSILRLTFNGGTGNVNTAFAVGDYFTPFDQATLAADDNDVGSSGLTLIPNHRLGTACGKDGVLYLVNLDQLGHYDPKANSGVLQALPGAVGTAFTDNNFSTAAYFLDDDANNWVYYIGENDFVRQFQLSGGLLSTFPVHQSGNMFGHLGGQPVVSANGTVNGILWAIEYVTGGANGVLHAYNADDVSQPELYNSNQNAPRDNFGAAVKFSVPTIINGKVYVGSQTQLAIYGNL